VELVAIEKTVEENELLLKNLEIRDGVLQTINYYKEIGFSRPWIGYCVKKDGIIVGMAGFKGKPLNGKVEIAYATNEPFRGKGIGTEICKLMVQLSKNTNPEIIISARTLAEKNFSTRILEKNGFEFQGVVNDKDDGEVWEWSIPTKH
jgi:RimJ/RimL family protein N-acetyltransferase